ATPTPSGASRSLATATPSSRPGWTGPSASGTWPRAPSGWSAPTTRRAAPPWGRSPGGTPPCLRGPEGPRGGGGGRAATGGTGAGPDGGSVGLAAESGEVLLWDFEGPPRRFRGHTAPVTAVAFDPNGREVRSVSEDGTSRLWDVRTGQELRRFWPDQQEPLKCAALSADGSTALTAGVSGRVDWWRLSDGRLLGSFPAGTDWVRCVTFLSDADGNEVGFVAGGDDETLRVVPFAAGAEPR